MNLWNKATQERHVSVTFVNRNICWTSQVAPKIKGKMMEKGQTMIGYQPLGDNVNFFRCVFSNPATQREDVDFLLDEIAHLGSDL